jgi:hypothetical protein
MKGSRSRDLVRRLEEIPDWLQRPSAHVPGCHPCLNFAIEHKIDFGIWAGASARTRVRLRSEFSQRLPRVSLVT